MKANCEYCLNYAYDEEFDEYVCEAAGAIDEDDYVRMMHNDFNNCPYFRFGDDYTIVRKQN